AIVHDPATAAAWTADAGGAEVRAETHVVQSIVKPPVSAGDAPKTADTTLPRATNALSEFALPAAQLVPATLIGLQVDAATGWPMQPPGGHVDLPTLDPTPSPVERDGSRRHDPAEAEEPPPEEHKDEAPAQADTALPARVVTPSTDAEAIEKL